MANKPIQAALKMCGEGPERLPSPSSCGVSNHFTASIPVGPAEMCNQETQGVCYPLFGHQLGSVHKAGSSPGHSGTNQVLAGDPRHLWGLEEPPCKQVGCGGGRREGGKAEAGWGAPLRGGWGSEGNMTRVFPTCSGPREPAAPPSNSDCSEIVLSLKCQALSYPRSLLCPWLGTHPHPLPPPELHLILLVSV